MNTPAHYGVTSGGVSGSIGQRVTSFGANLNVMAADSGGQPTLAGDGPGRGGEKRGSILD